MKVAVIGAGPAGVSAAYELTKTPGMDVEVFEASPYIGGMARSFDLWGQRVDLGPHRFFSKEPKINAFFEEIIEENYTLVNRLTRIYYRNKFFNYPLKIGNVLGNLDVLTIFVILKDYFLQRLFPIRNPETFEDWVTNRFGKKLFEIFFKNYSEKLWGIPCSKIDADWAAQRIKSLSLWGAVVSALKNNKGNKHKTLVDQFAYPKAGTGTLYEEAVQKLEARGGKVHLSNPIQKVLVEENKVHGLVLQDGTQIQADVVISSMPMTHLIKGLPQVPQHVLDATDALYFRNTLLVYLEVEALDLFEDNWIYVHAPEVKHGRITNFRNWCPSLNGDKKTSILCLEYWAFDQDEIWSKPDEALCTLAKEEIRKLDLIPENCAIPNAKVIRVPKCYPVYETGYLEHLKIAEEYLSGIEGLVPIGRYGSFKYNNQDHSILMGLLAAEKIAEGKDINLWSINTDTEYQEEAKIKDVLNQ